jgi:hypothetical protein
MADLAVRVGGRTIVTTRRVPNQVTVFSVRKRGGNTELESKLQNCAALVFRVDGAGNGVRSAKEFGLGKMCGPSLLRGRRFERGVRVGAA